MTHANGEQVVIEPGRGYEAPRLAAIGILADVTLSSGSDGDQLSG